jgi:hypothetical protein
MKVRIGDAIYDSTKIPILVVLSEADKENIAGLGELTKYCSFPERGFSKATIREFMGDAGIAACTSQAHLSNAVVFTLGSGFRDTVSCFLVKKEGEDGFLDITAGNPIAVRPEAANRILIRIAKEPVKQ